MLQARNNGGFTLIEVLMVVIVISILALISIPVFLGQKSRAQDARAISALRTAADQLSAARVPNIDYTAPYLNTSEKLVILMSDEKAYIFRAGGPGVYSTAPEDIVVTWMGTITIGLQSRSDSGSFFCMVVSPQTPLMLGRSEDPDTCNGATNGWEEDAPEGQPLDPDAIIPPVPGVPGGGEPSGGVIPSPDPEPTPPTPEPTPPPSPPAEETVTLTDNHGNTVVLPASTRKVVVCHKRGHTLMPVSFDMHAMPAHLGHGDNLDLTVCS